jgi:preprotein translocase subunit SecG
MFMLIVHLVTVAFLIILGIIFLNGKGAFLIAGYNAASSAEKRKYDEKALCKFMGKSMLALSACWLVVASSAVTDSMIPFWTGIGLFLAVCIFAIVYANTHHRFRR